MTVKAWHSAQNSVTSTGVPNARLDSWGLGEEIKFSPQEMAEAAYRLSSI